MMFSGDTGGRQQRFEQVAMPNSESLLRTALRLCGRRHEAEDLVQEAMLRAWKSFDQFDPGTNCKAWLFTIMLNVFYSQVRRARPHVDIEGMDVPALHRTDEAALAREVLAAVDRLDENQRLVLMLATIEGFTIEEVSSMLRIAPGTVASRLGRARSKLRTALRIGKDRIAV
ncbi:MAG: sigma-70 family RNA polymerase sigma factor [Acidobacteria bacterium]|nr:sigma-70 family RNA polymerase sigma factor [Acidobacteriota bacterium]